LLRDSLKRPLHDLRISVTDRCNFRCGYCMPRDIFGKGYPFLKSSALLTHAQIELLVKVFAELGVRKIRLTGGEPLLRKDLEKLIGIIAVIPGIEDVAITTNASLLTRKRAESLKQSGIERINISLDALTPHIYEQINEIPYPLEDILGGIRNALEAGFRAVKINMVVQKGVNETDILPMVSYFRGSGAILRFIEFMDVGNHNQWNMDKVFGARDILGEISAVFPMEPLDGQYDGEVAKRWRFKDGQGEIGIISSITQPFCGDCSRARLSAKGELFTCLFAGSGVDLKKFLVAGLPAEEIRQRISAVWKNRNDQYSMKRNPNPAGQVMVQQPQKVEMSYIGG